MTEQEILALIEAAKQRHSVRNFLPEALPHTTLDATDRFIENLDVPFENHTEIRRFKATPGKGLYNNGINGPDNFAVFAQTDRVSISKAGFCGQLVMLMLTELRAATCWFGHYKLQGLAQYQGEELATRDRIKESTWGMGYGYGNVYDVGERAICCIAGGIAKPNAHRLVDIVAGRNGSGRKPLEQLLEQPTDLNNLPDGVLQALDLARLAPSAANSQMWRFGLHDGGKTITVAKPVGYKHFKWEHPDVDIGICAAQLWLGLLGAGYAPKVDVCQDQDRAMWTFRL